jgi:hypothetical protein
MVAYLEALQINGLTQGGEALSDLEQRLGMTDKEMAAYLKEQQEAIQQRLDWESNLYQKRLQYETDVATQAVEHGTQVYAFEAQRAGFERDARLRAVEATPGSQPCWRC